MNNIDYRLTQLASIAEDWVGKKRMQEAFTEPREVAILTYDIQNFEEGILSTEKALDSLRVTCGHLVTQLAADRATLARLNSARDTLKAAAFAQDERQIPADPSIVPSAPRAS